MEGPQEAQVVSQLLKLRDELSGRKPGSRRGEVEALRLETMSAVNDYFHDRLVALPEIAEYLDKLAASDRAALTHKRDNRVGLFVVWVMPRARSCE